MSEARCPICGVGSLLDVQKRQLGLAPRKPASDWISVDEQSPYPYQDVWVLFANNRIELAHIGEVSFGKEWKNMRGDRLAFGNSYLKAWTPLVRPDPLKTEGEKT